jgi:hypothetical protein
MTNAIKALLQMTSVSLQPVPSLYHKCTLTYPKYKKKKLKNATIVDA